MDQRRRRPGQPARRFAFACVVCESVLQLWRGNTVMPMVAFLFEWIETLRALTAVPTRA